MLPFEIREQLNLTLARPYLTFKPRARKRDCTPDISNIVVFNRYTYPVTNTPTSNLSALQLPTFSRGQTTRNNNEHLSSSLLLSPRRIIRDKKGCRKTRKGKFGTTSEKGI